MEYFIITYKNTFDAMESERILNEKGYVFKVMPTPTSITQSCGICIRFELDQQEKIKEIFNEKIIKYKKIFKRDSYGFTEI